MVDETKTVNLQNWIGSSTARSLSGKDRGATCRRKANLNRLDSSDGSVSILIPQQLEFLSESFFLGMFGPSVNILGETRFREKYSFKGPDLKHVIDQGIRSALNHTSPFG